MLILTVYSWHHYLKGNLLKGKRNRRLDTLLARLFDALEHFQYRHDRQELGFEGKDLVSLRLAKMESDARIIPESSISVRVSQLVSSPIVPISLTVLRLTDATNRRNFSRKFRGCIQIHEIRDTVADKSWNGTLC